MRSIVITTILPPSEAVRAFAKIPGFRLVVIGDRRTPCEWSCPPAEYLPPEASPDAARRLHPLLPFNHYCRKMLGYIRAMELGTDVIVDTDDDNVPKSDWAFPPFDGAYRHLEGGQGFVNVYELFTDQRIWPRGLPLDLVSRRGDLRLAPTSLEARVGVWQGLADEDPDVDAIYRLAIGEPCTFARGEPVVLAPGTFSPFNSQNTAIRRELFPLLYLPVHVSFRFTDILRGLVAQPIMAAAGYRLGCTDATVVQRRNPHDCMRDFMEEVPMHQHGRRALEIALACVRADASVSDNLATTYEALRAEGIVEDAELAPLDAWLDAVARVVREA